MNQYTDGWTAARPAKGARGFCVGPQLPDGVNVFCFVFIEGAYLNRYLILAVLFLVPVLAIVVTRERNAYLRRLFLLLLSVQLGLSAMLLLADTREQEIQARERGRDMMEAASFLQEEGYTHGYGTFWNVRVMQERTQGP